MRRSVIIFLFLILFVEVKGIVTGQALVEKARKWKGTKYEPEKPLNKTWGGQKGSDGFYWYGTTWDPDDSPILFDCSGLVSYCAGLRRHYITTELEGHLFGEKRSSWDVAEPGDIVFTPPNSENPHNHVRILSINMPEDSLIYYVHAPGVGRVVSEDFIPYDWLIDHNGKAYPFKSDNVGPEIIVTNIQDNGVYTAPVEIHYSAEDPDESSNQIFIKGNYKKGEKVTQPGEHILEIFAQDWTGLQNQTHKVVHFKIIGPPQVVYASPRGENVDIYSEITIGFSQKMNPSSFEGGIEIKNKVKNSSVEILEKKWENNFTKLILKVYDPVIVGEEKGLEFKTKYEVKILGTVRDSAGETLDGNKKDV